MIRTTKLIDTVGLSVEKPPDHSIIIWHFNLGYTDELVNPDGHHEPVAESK